MNAMHTNRPTQNDELAGEPTAPPRSRARTEGTLWAERLFCQARVAAGDAERFMAGLKGKA